MTLRAYILCEFAGRSSLYFPWADQLSIPVEIVTDFRPDWQVPDDAGLLITHLHYSWQDLSALRRIHSEHPNVPVLILSDGILEYRNTWEHPSLPDGCMFQPLFGHKLACIGRSQTRIVESWGNPGKCEVVGLPRFDAVASSGFPPVQTQGPLRLLVATANTPSFNDAQRQTVIESLSHLRKQLEDSPVINGRPLEVTWRLRAGLDAEIGLPPASEGADLPPLSEVIDEVDAVITTPSTLYLESVMKDRPTAILDFHNTPLYVGSAWAINAPNHFPWIIEELESRPAAKMLFQQTVLHDSLQCATPATPRIILLAEAMIKARRECTASGNPLKLPHRIVTDTEKGFFPVLDSFELRRLYPDNYVFGNHDVKRLQIELDAAIKQMKDLPEVIQDLRVRELESSDLIEDGMLLKQRLLGRIELIRNEMDAWRKRFLRTKKRVEELEQELAELKGDVPGDPS